MGASSAAKRRLASVDLMRGLVMVIMALDHTRDYFSDAHFDPTDLARTDAALFFTRWITHFCAPVFFFLVGFSAHLSALRGRSGPELSVHLGLRGLWLILLEATLVHFAWTFTLAGGKIGLGVLWALGWSMLALALLVSLPRWMTAVFGVILIAGHNLLDGMPAQALNIPGWLWTILHSPGGIRLTDSLAIGPYYALIPWIGVPALGYAAGPSFLRWLRDRPALLMASGALLTAAFVALRLLNGYGDPRPWSMGSDIALMLMSFLNTTKYPPSLLYLLMTLGPAIALLAAFQGVSERLGRFLMVLGRAPLFFYVSHLYLIHGLALGAGYATGHGIGPFVTSFENFPKDYGFGLPVVYTVWIAVVLSLYPVCAWFGDLRERRRFRIFSYL